MSIFRIIIDIDNYQYCDRLVKKIRSHQYLLEMVLEIDYIVVPTTFNITMLICVNNIIMHIIILFKIFVSPKKIKILI